MQTLVRVLIADDHPVVRIGVRHLLRAEPRFAVVGESMDGRETLRLVDSLRPDILLLDVAMPGLSGIDVLRHLSRNPGPTRTILLTAALEPDQLSEALQLGARAVVMKDSAAPDLVRAVHAVSRGQCWIPRQILAGLVDTLQNGMPARLERPSFGLTPRELEVVSTMVAGYTNKDIARVLSISEETVKRHLSNIFDKLGVSNRLELGIFAVHHNLVAS